MSSVETTSSTSSTRILAGIPTGSTTTNRFADAFTTTVIPPTATGNNGGNGGNGGNNGNNGFNSGGGGGVNSTLYLFTFLTTLLLLLAVSCGIVIRSFVLRRRFHRRVEEAIAAGVLLPGQGDITMGPGGNISALRRPIGEKPKMWEAWIDPSIDSRKYPSTPSEWSNIQPLAAAQISEVSPDAAAPPKTELTQEAPVETSLLDRLGLHSIFRRNRPQTRAAPNINPTPASPDIPLPTLGYNTPTPPDGAQTEKTKPPSVQVAVFIAMPDASRPRYIPGASSSPIDEHGVKGKQRSSELPSGSADDHEIPEICIGISQAQVAREPSDKPSQDQISSAPKS